MSKNPFEIRADILALAKEYMDEQARINLSYAMKIAEQTNKSMEEIQKMNPFYSTDELLEQANKMYAFVCGNVKKKDN